MNCLYISMENLFNELIIRLGKVGDVVYYLTISPVEIEAHVHIPLFMESVS